MLTLFSDQFCSGYSVQFRLGRLYTRGNCKQCLCNNLFLCLGGWGGGKQYVFSADCRPLSGCLLLFPRKLMWTDSTVIRFFILLVYYLFHFSLAEWIQLTGKHMADEALGKSNIHEEYCAVRKKENYNKTKKECF